MFLLFTILLIVAGILGAAALIIQKQPNARDVIAKLVPFQGIIGIILLVWSLIMLIRFLPAILQFITLTSILVLVTLLVGIGLGFLLGYGLIKQYVLSKNANAARSGDAMQMSLAKYQGPLGLVAILLGLWMLINILTSPLYF
jgi:hypothetical protein